MAGLAFALSTTAACADVPQDKLGSSPTPTPAATVSLVSKAASCSAYDALETEIKGKMLPIMTEVLAAQENPAAADPIKLLNSLNQFKAIVAEYEARLAPIAAAAGDAPVKAALDAELAVTRKVKADMDAAGVDPTKLQAAIEGADGKPADDLAALCGK